MTLIMPIFNMIRHKSWASSSARKIEIWSTPLYSSLNYWNIHFYFLNKNPNFEFWVRPNFGLTNKNRKFIILIVFSDLEFLKDDTHFAYLNFWDKQAQPRPAGPTPLTQTIILPSTIYSDTLKNSLMKISSLSVFRFKCFYY